MGIQELLKLISDTAKAKSISEPYIVGGLPRDKLLNRIKDVQDIDLTTGDDSVKLLAQEINKILSAQNPEVHMKVFPDGHTQITIEGMKLDFSSNFTSPQVGPLLKKGNIEATPMIVELLSRDFTCNTLIMDTGLKNIKDPTGMGINDCNQKIIRTPIKPEYTLTNNPKRIIRVIYLSTKLGFDTEQEILDFVASKPELVKGLKPQYVTQKINESLRKDPKKTIDLITKMNLWQHIPISQELAPHYVGTK